MSSDAHDASSSGRWCCSHDGQAVTSPKILGLAWGTDSAEGTSGIAEAWGAGTARMALAEGTSGIAAACGAPLDEGTAGMVLAEDWLGMALGDGRFEPALAKNGFMVASVDDRFEPALAKNGSGAALIDDTFELAESGFGVALSRAGTEV
jgi:hypothetical protein